MEEHIVFDSYLTKPDRLVLENLTDDLRLQKEAEDEKDGTPRTFQRHPSPSSSPFSPTLIITPPPPPF